MLTPFYIDVLRVDFAFAAGLRWLHCVLVLEESNVWCVVDLHDGPLGGASVFCWNCIDGVTHRLFGATMGVRDMAD